MNTIQRELRKRILRERLVAAFARRARLEESLRALKLRESKRVTRGILDDMSAHDRSTRTVR